MVKTGVKKTGRPARYEKREELATVSFRADAATLSALEVIVGDIGAGVVAPRAVAIRRAIQETAERINKSKGA